MDGKTNSIGRPRIPYTGADFMEVYRRLGCTWSDVAKIFGVSVMTIHRRLKEDGYKKEYIK